MPPSDMPLLAMLGNRMGAELPVGRLDDQREHVERGLVLGVPAAALRERGGLDGAAVAEHGAVLKLVAGVGDDLAVAQPRGGLAGRVRGEDRDRRLDAAAVVDDALVLEAL